MEILKVKLAKLKKQQKTSKNLFMLSFYNLYKICLSIVVDESYSGVLSKYLMVGLSLHTSLHST